MVRSNSTVKGGGSSTRETSGTTTEAHGLTGAELRKRRQTLGLTLEALSSGICSTAYLSLIEQGHRQASPRIAALLLARLEARAGEAGIAIQIAGLRLAEWQLRQTGSLSADVRSGPALRNHQQLLDALESEARDEFGTALAQVEAWFETIPNSRELKSFGARLRVRLLRELGRDAEALKFASDLVSSAPTTAKVRQDDLLELVFQTAELYSAAGLWRDAIRVIDSHKGLINEPRQQVNAFWARSSAYYAKGDFINALSEVNSAIEAISDLDLPVARASLMTNAVWYELHAGIVDAPAQLAQLDAAVEVLREHGQASRIAWANCAYALLAAKLQDRDEFIRWARTAITLSINTQTRDHDELIISLAEIAVVSGEQEFALELLAAIDSRTRKVLASRAEAAILYRAGKVAEKLGNFVRAFNYLNGSHELMGFRSKLIDSELNS